MICSTPNRYPELRIHIKKVENAIGKQKFKIGFIFTGSVLFALYSSLFKINHDITIDKKLAKTMPKSQRYTSSTAFKCKFNNIYAKTRLKNAVNKVKIENSFLLSKIFNECKKN